MQTFTHTSADTDTDPGTRRHKRTDIVHIYHGTGTMPVMRPKGF